VYDLRNALLSDSTPLFIAMYRKIATLSLLLTAVLGTPAAAGVIGEDGRRAPGAEDHLLVEALGLIYCAKVVDGRYRRSAGTASIVGNRSTILTAAHVFADDSGRRGPAVRFDAIADCVFRQYDSQGNVTAEVAFQSADMGEYRRNPAAPDQDWAVLRTTAPLPGAHRPLPFANGGEDIFATASLSIRIVAFHADIRAARTTVTTSWSASIGHRRISAISILPCRCRASCWRCCAAMPGATCRRMVSASPKRTYLTLTARGGSDPQCTAVT